MLDCVALDKIFHALADPARRFMIEALCDGDASVSWLAEPFPHSLPVILRHLQVLETSGLVHTEKNGRTRTCRIEPQGLRLLERWIAQRRQVWDRRLQAPVRWPGGF